LSLHISSIFALLPQHRLVVFRVNPEMRFLFKDRCKHIWRLTIVTPFPSSQAEPYSGCDLPSRVLESGCWKQVAVWRVVISVTRHALPLFTATPKQVHFNSSAPDTVSTLIRLTRGFAKSLPGHC